MLDNINLPEDLKKLPPHVLPELANELREHFMQLMNQIGGHFGASLGCIELTIALHYVFNAPTDKLVWDVGHQALAHKILTGRKDRMQTLRKIGGLAPFPRRGESPYDAFSVGHSSTSISAALGMSLARQEGEDYKTVAIIGDGAMTAGMAFEALNHAGAEKANLLVILNDNEMSISENVGALSNYFARILSGRKYISIREGGKKILNHMPASLKELASKTEQHLKGMLLPGTLFEELGFNYWGPCDGHDVIALTQTLQSLKDLKGPQLLHIYTQKGKGYSPAERDPIGFHAVPPGYLDKVEDDKSSTPLPSKPTFSRIFGDWLCDMAAQSPELVAITPAMREGSGMVEFSKRFPQQYIDVGIAEQHAVTLAAGLACEGKKPVVAIYSTFLQRAYDQLIHDVCMQNLPVLFAIDRAGLVGGDGVSHQGAFDLSFLNCVPGISILTPANEAECRAALTTAFAHPGPCAVRYPRGTGVGQLPKPQSLEKLPWGKGQVVREGQTVAILCFGTLLYTALPVAERLDCTVVNMRFAKPLDVDLIKQMATTHRLLVTLEENTVKGGVGSSVCQEIMSQSISCGVLNLGLPDQFIEHGDPGALLAEVGLSAEAIEKAIRERLVQSNIPSHMPTEALEDDRSGR